MFIKKIKNLFFHDVKNMLVYTCCNHNTLGKIFQSALVWTKRTLKKNFKVMFSKCVATGLGFQNVRGSEGSNVFFIKTYPFK